VQESHSPELAALNFLLVATASRRAHVCRVPLPSRTGLAADDTKKKQQGRWTMKRPLIAAFIVAATAYAPIAAQATAVHHHKHKGVAFHHPVRASYGMYTEPGVLVAPTRNCESVNVGNFEECAPVTLGVNGGG
jgi:hypothetical protein